MNMHENARLTFARRQELVADMMEKRTSPVVAAAKHGVSAPTACEIRIDQLDRTGKRIRRGEGEATQLGCC